VFQEHEQFLEQRVPILSTTLDPLLIGRWEKVTRGGFVFYHIARIRSLIVPSVLFHFSRVIALISLYYMVPLLLSFTHVSRRQKENSNLTYVIPIPIIQVFVVTDYPLIVS
jgi:hypothetical protein